jgi:hypothetical protein
MILMCQCILYGWIRFIKIEEDLGRGSKRQSVPSRRYGDAADDSRNIMRDYGKVGMGVVPRTFLRSIITCFDKIIKFVLLRVRT